MLGESNNALDQRRVRDASRGAGVGHVANAARGDDLGKQKVLVRFSFSWQWSGCPGDAAAAGLGEGGDRARECWLALEGA